MTSLRRSMCLLEWAWVMDFLGFDLMFTSRKDATRVCLSMKIAFNSSRREWPAGDIKGDIRILAKECCATRQRRKKNNQWIDIRILCKWVSWQIFLRIKTPESKRVSRFVQLTIALEDLWLTRQKPNSSDLFFSRFFSSTRSNQISIFNYRIKGFFFSRRLCMWAVRFTAGD